MIASFVTAVPAGAVVADVRWPGGIEAYRRGHRAEARYVDLETVLAAPAGPHGRHPLPTPEAFADGLVATGIGDADTVVGYDDAGGVIAARLVWMLRAVGVDAALLEDPGPLEATAEPELRSAAFAPRPWPAELLADLDHLDGVLLDARPRARYDGAPDDLDPRAGHIPGAVSVPCRENVGQGEESLRRTLAEAGVGPETEVVSSCGSGVTACHTLLVLERLGYRPGRLYPGSFSEWSRTDRPVARSRSEADEVG